MLTAERADSYARDWLAGWNSHDLERILGHYTVDIEWRSPLIVNIADNASGVIKGKAILRDYFAAALARYPDLMFRLISVFRGVDSLVIHYESVNGRLAAEVFEFAPDGLVHRVMCHYQ